MPTAAVWNSFCVHADRTVRSPRRLVSRPFVAVRWLISHTRRPEMAGQTRCLGRRCNDEDEKKCIAQYTKARVNALYKHQLLQNCPLHSLLYLWDVHQMKLWESTSYFALWFIPFFFKFSRFDYYSNLFSCLAVSSTLRNKKCIMGSREASYENRRLGERE